ncbi:DUF3347 domain-containing protein [Hymenobacter roseosalivarius]|nr:DUF3347 domain-containing protein [Hymenobacter roseosalivarius]
MKPLKSTAWPALFLTGTLLIQGCNQQQEGKGSVSDTYMNPDNVAGRVPGTNQKTTQMGVDDMLQGTDMVFQNDLPPAFKAGFDPVVTAYLAMKDAFVADNAPEVEKQADQMMQLLQRTPDALLAGEAAAFWKEKKGFLMTHLKLYKAAEKDQAQRQSFVFLSTVMVKSVKAFGYGAQKLYVDYCPMANEQKGAYWLSQTKEIRNPYMGQKMPTCGEVKQEI